MAKYSIHWVLTGTLQGLWLSISLPSLFRSSLCVAATKYRTPWILSSSIFNSLSPRVKESKGRLGTLAKRRVLKPLQQRDLNWSVYQIYMTRKIRRGTPLVMKPSGAIRRFCHGFWSHHYRIMDTFFSYLGSRGISLEKSSSVSRTMLGNILWSIRNTKIHQERKRNKRTNFISS